MPRIFRNKRDSNEGEIFQALYEAYCHPIRGHDADIYCRHVDGYGVLLEVKGKAGRLRKIQHELAGIFKDRYYVVRSVSDALKACGVQTNIQEQA